MTFNEGITKTVLKFGPRETRQIMYHSKGNDKSLQKI